MAEYRRQRRPKADAWNVDQNNSHAWNVGQNNSHVVYSRDGYKPIQISIVFLAAE